MEEEKDEDENHVQDDQIANKRKRKLQQVVSISLRVTVINWRITDADQKGEQGLVLRAIAKFPSDFRGNYKVVDNCGGHNASPELRDVLLKTNTKLRYFSPCATDLVQPADSFVISKIKDEWTRLWEAREDAHDQKRRLVRHRAYERVPGKASSCFFLELAAKTVRAVNAMRDICGLTYARKAMIRCGMALDVGGRWHKSQLTPELQRIIGKCCIHYNGTPVPAPGLRIV